MAKKENTTVQVIEWRKYNLALLIFESVEKAQEYISHNPTHTHVMVKGEVISKSDSIYSGRF